MMESDRTVTFCGEKSPGTTLACEGNRHETSKVEMISQRGE